MDIWMRQRIDRRDALCQSTIYNFCRLMTWRLTVMVQNLSVEHREILLQTGDGGFSESYILWELPVCWYGSCQERCICNLSPGASSRLTFDSGAGDCKSVTGYVLWHQHVVDRWPRLNTRVRELGEGQSVVLYQSRQVEQGKFFSSYPGPEKRDLSLR